MTVSQRAHNIRQINPGMSWSEAMKQAYEDVARPVIEQEEEEAAAQLESLAATIADAYNRAAIFTHGNDLVSEIIAQALDNAVDSGVKYPAISVMNKIKQSGGVEKIREMVFWSSQDATYESRYRLGNGKISSEWWNNINLLMEALNVDASELDGYSVMANYFI